MKFDNDFPERVKSATDIVEIVREYVRLRKSGANHIGLCPFHSEKTPSFHVHSARQFFYCFGCHAKGDVFKFVQDMERCGFPEALKLLAERAGIPVPQTSPSEADAATKQRQRLLEVQLAAAELFHSQLTNSEEGKRANEYLRVRGLSIESIKRFQIGYALGYSDGLIRRLGRKFPIDLLVAGGLVQREEGGDRHYDRFRKRVIFPITDESGRVIAFGGRILGEGQPKYLNSPETPVYNKSRTLYALNTARESIRKLDFAVLVEGYMDCISLHQVGITNAVASCGTSLTDQQAKLLARYTDHIVINYDPDSAGAAAAMRSLSTLLEGGFKIRVLTLPNGDDPDAFIRKNGKDAYQNLLDNALPYFEYLLEQGRSKHDLTRIEGKIEAINLVLPYLVRISNRIEREERVKRVAEFFGVDEPAIRVELKKLAGGQGAKFAMSLESAKANLKPAEKYLIKSILDFEGNADEIIEQLAVSQDYIGLQSETIFREMISLYRESGRVEISRLQEALKSDTDQDLLNQALFAEGNREPVVGCLAEIKRQKAEQEIALLQKQIKQAEISQDFALLASLHSRKTELKRMTAT